jgi:hypothetical protein
MALLLQTQPLHKHSQPEAPHQTEQQPAPEPSKGLIAANAHALRNQGPQRLNQHLQTREGVIASQRQTPTHNAALLAHQFAPIPSRVAHNGGTLKQELGTSRHSAMTELTITAGVCAAMETSEILKAGLAHQQIGRDAKTGTTHRARLIKTKDLIQLLTS